MDIGQLRSFLRVADLGGFTRAAEAAGLSQPAISQQIARLEAELGCPVLERHGRHVSLTEAGQKLRERAEEILALVDDTAAEVRDDGETGRLVVAAIPTIAPFLLPRALSAFRASRPAARVEVNEETTEDLIKGCQRGEIDIGVLALPAETRHLEAEPLFDEELFLVLPAGHALAGRPEVPLDLVKPEPFVMLQEAHCLSGHIRSFCDRRRFQLIATGKTSQLATVQELVALGHGLSFIPAMARRHDTSDRRAYASVAGKRPTRTIAACWNPYRYRSRLTLHFLEVLRDLPPDA